MNSNREPPPFGVPQKTARLRRDLDKRIPLSVDQSYQEKMRIFTGNETIARQPVRFDLDDVRAVYDFAVGERCAVNMEFTNAPNVPQDGSSTTSCTIHDNPDLMRLWRQAKVVYFKAMGFRAAVGITTLHFAVSLDYISEANPTQARLAMMNDLVNVSVAAGGNNIPFQFHAGTAMPLPSGRSFFGQLSPTPTTERLLGSTDPTQFTWDFRRIGEATGNQLVDKLNLQFEFWF